MKRSLIIAAVSALATGAALAQGSVTLYGRVNVSGEYQKNIGAVDEQYVLQNSASRFGLLGVEDLGGGLKAGFNLEHGFNVDTGTATSTAFWGRGAEVNLSSKFGTIRLGRFTSEAYYATADFVSMHNHDTGTSEDKLYAYLDGDSNKIAYRLPTFVPDMSIEIAYSAGEGSGPDAFEAAWNYKVGGLAMGAGYQKVEDFGSTTKAEQYALRALYETGPFIIGGYWQHDTNGRGSDLGNRDTWRVSGSWTIGASEFHLNYGGAGDYSKLANSSASQFTAAYNYNLSKRTKVYAFYTQVDNGDAFSYFGTTAANGAVLDPSSFAVGIRHNF
jgi:predicted porin